MNREHILSILVRNKPGVLTKIAGMFYRRDYNIQSITVGKMHAEGTSKIVISVPVDDRDVELLRRQIENLVDVQSAQLLDREMTILMEVCIARIGYQTAEERRSIMASAAHFQTRIRLVGERSLTLELSESPEILDDFVEAMRKHDIQDISRTGRTALGAGLAPIQRDAPITETDANSAPNQ